MTLQMEIQQAGVSSDRRQGLQEDYLGGFQIGLTVTVCSVAILALAALGTFLLVLASRRTTLRHVNASLKLISDRLQQLPRDGVGGRTEASTGTAEGHPSKS
jgi:hypothetical protein